MQWMRCPCDKIYKMADIGDFLQQYIQSDVFYRIIKKNSDRTFDLMVLIRRADGGIYKVMGHSMLNMCQMARFVGKYSLHCLR